MIFSNVLLASLLACALQADATRSSFHSSHARRSLAIKRDLVADLLRERGLGDVLGECSVIASLFALVCPAFVLPSSLNALSPLPSVSPRWPAILPPRRRYSVRQVFPAPFSVVQTPRRAVVLPPLLLISARRGRPFVATPSARRQLLWHDHSILTHRAVTATATHIILRPLSRPLDVVARASGSLFPSLLFHAVMFGFPANLRWYLPHSITPHFLRTGLPAPSGSSNCQTSVVWVCKRCLLARRCRDARVIITETVDLHAG